MGMSVSSGGGVKAEPNVTPMIDVMLVLLIIFMITIPQINAGFTAVPPEGQNLKPHPEEDGDQVLGIDDQGRYYLNKNRIRNEDLEALALEVAADHTCQRHLVIHDEDTQGRGHPARPLGPSLASRTCRV